MVQKNIHEKLNQVKSQVKKLKASELVSKNRKK